MNVYSGSQHIRGLNLNNVGTGSEQTIPIDLGNYYALPQGLVMDFNIYNSAGSSQIVSIKAYGAKIKYAV